MKLASYLKDHDITHRDFAKSVGAHFSQVSRWASGERVPSLAIAARISRATKGEVAFEDFVDAATVTQDAPSSAHEAM